MSVAVLIGCFAGSFLFAVVTALWASRRREGLAVAAVETNRLLLLIWFVVAIALATGWLWILYQAILRIGSSASPLVSLVVILVVIQQPVYLVLMGVLPLIPYLQSVGPRRRVGIMNLTRPSIALAQALGEYRRSRYELVGFLGRPTEQVSIENLGFRYLGDLDALESIFVREDLKVLAYDRLEKQAAEELVGAASLSKVDLMTVTDLYEKVCGRVMLTSTIAESSALFYEASVQYELTKRVLDFCLGLAGILVLAPLMLMIALLIKLDSPGPVLHSLEVVGKRGKIFRRLKFRTMQVGWGGDSPHEAASWPRRTRVGHLLSRTHMDELAQLFNILRGDMSIVGPRAEQPFRVEDLSEQFAAFDQRLAVRPGITGWSQVSYLYQNPSPDPVAVLEHDLYYVKHRSLTLDSLVLIRTMQVVLIGPEWPGMEPMFRKLWGRASLAVLDDRPDSFDRAIDATVDYLGQLLWFDVGERKEVLRYLHLRELNSGTAYESLKFPTTLPLLFLRSPKFMSVDIDDLRALLTRCYGEDVKFAILVVFLEGDAFDLMVKELREKLSLVFAYDIVPLSRRDLQHIASASQPARALLRRIIARMDVLRRSPFVLTGPTPDHMFFGREHEIQLIVENARNITYAVIGGRRIGKTSVLLRLHRARLPAAGFCAIYHDCSTTPTYEDFFAATIRDWRSASPCDVPDTFGDLLPAPPMGKLPALLLDEADKLVSADRANGWRLFNALRALANTGYCQIVLSGERTLRDALHDPKSPLFNFANELILGPLDFRAVEELVTRPLRQLEIELVDEEVLVERIWAFTSGHPNVVQRLCCRLLERLNELGTRHITLDDVDAVIEDPAFQRDDFLSTFWEAGTPLEKIISLLMADGKGVRSLRSVREALAEHCNLYPKAREVDDALQRLVDLRSILKHTPTGYEFAVKAFPHVIGGTLTLDDMLEIFTEEYLERGE